jgi:hypothetical protein
MNPGPTSGDRVARGKEGRHARPHVEPLPEPGSPLWVTGGRFHALVILAPRLHGGVVTSVRGERE